ncbi:MAG: FeoC-like transcriptional regulator [Gammaproteobacteria bacterium]|mgnify:CR=1 FL=1|nr:FeoC-like transcriptional regulator [Gammaproteobacteria bacterium]HXK56475.1 FeoC-like transcriptional regulator [Gammaproteobacteria bacterium]
MILAKIKRYLQQRGQVSLADIALHFDTPPDAVRGMLETLLRKGLIRRQLLDSACGSSCCKCDSATTELYEWADSGSSNAHVARPLPMPGMPDRQ